MTAQLIDDSALTVHDEGRQGALRRAGFSLTSSAELARFFDYILGAALDPDNSLSQAIIGIDADSMAAATAPNSNIHSALFNEVRDRRRVASGQDDAVIERQGSVETFEHAIADGNIEALANFIASATTQQLARLISVDASSIDPRQGSILALGLDSLVAVELRNWIARQFDAPLQSTEILANQTVQILAEKIIERSKKVANAPT